MVADIDRRIALVHSIRARLKVLQETKAYDDIPALMREFDAAMADPPSPGP
jgi:hypothetical protein